MLSSPCINAGFRFIRVYTVLRTIHASSNEQFLQSLILMQFCLSNISPIPPRNADTFSLGSIESSDNISINFNFIKLKKTNKIAKVLTAKESRALETYCFQHQKNYSVAILLSLYGGFRLGEVAGLKWEDIDFQNGLIHVNRTIERLKTTDNQNKTQLMVLEPKTHTSKRIVPIPDFVLKFLKIYYQNQDDVESNHYVYTGSCKIPDPRNIQYHYNKICKLLNFQSHYHSLRHTYATNCVMNNIDVKSLSEMLGHSSVSITLELYVHSSLEFKKDQINKLKIPSHIAELCVL